MLLFSFSIFFFTINKTFIAAHLYRERDTMKAPGYFSCITLFKLYVQRYTAVIYIYIFISLHILAIHYIYVLRYALLGFFFPPTNPELERTFVPRVNSLTIDLPQRLISTLYLSKKTSTKLYCNNAYNR